MPHRRDARRNNAAGQLGQARLQLLAVVVGGGLGDLRLDLTATAHCIRSRPHRVKGGLMKKGEAA